MADGDLEKSRGPSGIKWGDKWHVIYKNSSLKRNNSKQYNAWFPTSSVGLKVYIPRPT